MFDRWGAVVCAGVFIVVFVCVMAAWWVHKVKANGVKVSGSVTFSVLTALI